MPCPSCKSSKPDLVTRTRAAMCHVCPHAIKTTVPEIQFVGFRGWWMRWIATPVRAARCTKHPGHVPKVGDKIPITVNTCPIGRHPDREGIVRWLGVRWYGVPMPIRVRLMIFARQHRSPRYYDGCGCVVRLKDWWSRLRRRRTTS